MFYLEGSIIIRCTRLWLLIGTAVLGLVVSSLDHPALGRFRTASTTLGVPVAPATSAESLTPPPETSGPLPLHQRALSEYDLERASLPFVHTIHERDVLFDDVFKKQGYAVCLGQEGDFFVLLTTACDIDFTFPNYGFWDPTEEGRPEFYGESIYFQKHRELFSVKGIPPTRDLAVTLGEPTPRSHKPIPNNLLSDELRVLRVPQGKEDRERRSPLSNAPAPLGA
jgi:hypothetical protein